MHCAYSLSFIRARSGSSSLMGCSHDCQKDMDTAFLRMHRTLLVLARQCDQGKDRLVAYRMWPPRNVTAKSAPETSYLRPIKTFDIDSSGIILIALVSFLEVPPRR